MTWQEYAACRGEDPELFFPIGTSGPALLQLQLAKAVCGRCAVQSLCLQWALLAQIDDGVWGGLSEDERRTLKRRTTRQRNPVATRPMW
jgi:WhiB family redox-sensing transcriptional regulator